jgi:hypothetical protein
MASSRSLGSLNRDRERRRFLDLDFADGSKLHHSAKEK